MRTKIATALLTLCVAFSITAQHHRKQGPKDNFTTEQKTTLLLKKMTLSLDLSDKQQQKMKPLVAEIVAKKDEMEAAKKANNGKRPQLSSDELYAKMNEKLDYQIAFQKKVKNILDEDQFEQYQEIRARMERAKKSHMKQAAQKRRGGHKGKGGQKAKPAPQSEA